MGGYIAVATVDLITSGEVTSDPVDQLAWPIPFVVGLTMSRENTVKQQ